MISAYKAGTTRKQFLARWATELFSMMHPTKVHHLKRSLQPQHESNAMKVSPEHLAHMRTAIALVWTRQKHLNHSQLVKNEGKAKDISKRVRHDWLYYAQLSPWIADTLSPLGIECSHLDTAVLHIMRELKETSFSSDIVKGQVWHQSQNGHPFNRQRVHAVGRCVASLVDCETGAESALLFEGVDQFLKDFTLECSPR